MLVPVPVPRGGSDRCRRTERCAAASRLALTPSPAGTTPPQCHPLIPGAGWRSLVVAEPGRPRPAPPPSALLDRQEREAVAEPGAGRRGEEGPPVGSAGSEAGSHQ